MAKMPNPLPNDLKNEVHSHVRSILEAPNEKTARLSEIAPAERARFVYEYDLGDSWRHDILVEKIFQPEKELAHPVCVDGKRSAPPEDCGGIGGYDEFVDEDQYGLRWWM